MGSLAEQTLENLNNRRKSEYPFEAQHPLGLRMRRLLSWYERGLFESEDADAQFIFCWIAFNSAYGVDESDRIINKQGLVRELVRQEEFFNKVITLDRQQKIRRLLKEKIFDSIQNILENEYIYRAFWLYEKGEERFATWLETLESQQVRVAKAYRQNNIKFILNTLFERLYVLRNQLLHGGATFRGIANRSQVEDGAKVLMALLPIIAELMMDGPEVNWGEPPFPLIKPI